MLPNVWIALAVTFIAAVAWLRLMDFIAQKGWIGGPLSRKLIHMGTGPIFVLCWLLFPEHSLARYLAALVPLLITAQFFLVGTGILRDQAAVAALSRTGDRREILRGPLLYGVVFVILTLVYWKNSPIGIIALMLLCGGDGLADVLGKRISSRALPWAPRKSTAGSLSMLFGGWVFAVAILAVYIGAGVFAGPLMRYIPGITVIALAGMVVESLPFSDIDNVTVAATAVMLGHLFF